MWQETLGDERVTVAVLDSSVDLSHPSLVGANLSVTEVTVPSSSGSAHGTQVASIIFGQRGSNVQGIAPRCRGLVIPLFRGTAEGGIAPCSQVDLAHAIARAVELGANIINISGGQLSQTGQAHPILADAVRRCTEEGVLIVAAAGNDGCDCLHIPAAMQSVLAVGAMDKHGRPLGASNWGNTYQQQGVLAPGRDIRGALPSGEVTESTGTSFAAPIVSGVAALLMSLQLKNRTRPDGKLIRQAILDSALKCDPQKTENCRRFLAGRLNPSGAVQLVQRGFLTMNDSSENETATPILALGQPAETSTGNVCTSAVAYDEIQIAGASPSTIQPSQRNVKPSQHPHPGNRSSAAQISASGCGCGGSNSPRLVYALGQLDVDLVSEARRDSIQQAMGGKSPHDLAALLAYIKAEPSVASAMNWVLMLDQTPIYAIEPSGPFAERAYGRLVEFLEDQLEGKAERLSVPGRIIGQRTLFNGYSVPVICPEIRGMYNWKTADIQKEILGEEPKQEGQEALDFRQKAHDLANFLERVYYELRNLGVSPQERSINFAATNAFETAEALKSARSKKMDLDSIEIERSPICRPESDCWDVKLIFFNPKEPLQTSREVHRFTVDVSDVVPVTVGPRRQWYIR